MRPYILAILMAMTVGAIVVAAYTLGAPPVASTAQQTPTAAQQTPTAAPTTAATTQTPAQARQPLVVEARVAPVRSVELTLPVSGVPIAEVLVREGDTVALGDGVALAHQHLGDRNAAHRKRQLHTAHRRHTGLDD